MGTKNNPGKWDCYSRLEPDEPHFVLMGRDPATPIVIMFWADIRGRMGEEQEKLEEAYACADTCAAWLFEHGRQDRYKTAIVAAEESLVARDNNRIKQLETENQELLEEVTRLRLLYEQPHLVVPEPLFQKEGGE